MFPYFVTAVRTAVAFLGLVVIACTVPWSTIGAVAVAALVAVVAVAALAIAA